MVGTATISTSQINVNPPSEGRCLRSDLSAASDGNSFWGYDSHSAILWRKAVDCRVFPVRKFAISQPLGLQEIDVRLVGCYQYPKPHLPGWTL